jgi:hypothetical protein
MLERNRRPRGRPLGPSPLFIDDCQLRLDALQLLSRTRGARFTDGHPAPRQALSTSWVLRWTDGGPPKSRAVVLAVTATAQHLGGARYWWRCSTCGRRCRVVLAVAPDAPIGCRVWQRARYGGSYPGRARRARFLALFRALGEGGLDLDDGELDLLLAPRRKAVRRGRRLIMRTARALERLRARCDALPCILNGGL